MCGRAKLTVPFATLAKLYRLEETDAPLLVPRRNIAPTDPIAVVRASFDGTRRLALVRWGFSGGDRPMFNARSESIATRPAFRAAFRKRRCLVLADAFYEWKTEGKRKLPHAIALASGEPFAMAGLWETQTTDDGEIVETCTVLTRAAAGVVSAIHTRMPVILAPESHDAWLDPSVTDPETLEAILAEALVDPLVAEPIDALPANDAAPPKRQLKLFG